MKKIIILLYLSLVMDTCLGGDAQKAFDEGANLARQVKGKTADVVRDLKPETLPLYKTNPDEGKYYKDETQITDDLAKDAGIAKATSEVGRAVEKSHGLRPQYDVDKTLPEMQRSKFIIDNSGNIAHGKDSAYVKCEDGKTKKCETTYTTETCYETTQVEDAKCTKDLNVKVQTKTLERDLDVALQVVIDGIEYKRERKGYPQIAIDLKTGEAHCNYNNCKVTVNQPLRDFPCNNLQAKYLGYQPFTRVRNTHVERLGMPNCDNGLKLNFVLNLDWYSTDTIYAAFTIPAKLSFHFSANDYVITDVWDNHCGDFANRMQQKMCVFKSEDCSCGAQTRVIDGISITRDCWQKTDYYTCSKGTTDNHCAPLREKKCDQIYSKCSQMLGDICLVYEQTYRCPTARCEDLGIACGGDTFCLSGDCTDHSYQKSQDFAKNIAALSALAEAQKDRQGTGENFTIFSGKAEKCAEKDPVSFIDCCSDSGWGKDAGLAKCEADEKTLAEHKEKKLTIEVGEYCSQYVLGTKICWLYKKSYCLFSSKLARIVQQFGRRDQLGIGFGDPEEPDCRGLTPNELQKIDFSKIDFSDFAEDLKNKTKEPDRKETEDKLKEKAKTKEAEYEKKCREHPGQC